MPKKNVDILVITPHPDDAGPLHQLGRAEGALRIGAFEGEHEALNPVDEGVEVAGMPALGRELARGERMEDLAERGVIA